MIIYDLRTDQITLDELVLQATATPVHIISKNGQTFVVEPTDDFEQEIIHLRHSPSFMAFLTERSRQKGSISLEELEAEIDAQLQQEEA